MMPFFFAELSAAGTGDIAREASLSSYVLIYLVGELQTQNLHRVTILLTTQRWGSLCDGFV